MNRLKKIFTPKEVLRELPVGLTVFYYEDRPYVLHISEEAAKIFNYSVEEYIEIFENSIEKIFEDKLQEFKIEINKLIPGSIPLNYTIFSPNKQGEYRWVNLCVSVEEREGYRVYYLISKDVTGVKEALDEKASLDALTGVLNRGAFEEQFNNKIKTFKNLEESAFILVDLDDFKKINDTYGHQEGDRVICHVAHILKSNFGRDYLVGRLGGDEFAIVFWNAKSKENIKKSIERIFKSLSNNISISVGVTNFSSNESKFSDLYRNADQQLYTVKHKNKGNYSIDC